MHAEALLNLIVCWRFDLAKVSAPVLGALGVLVLLLVLAPQALQFGLVLLAVAFATALSAVLVLTVIDLTGPTRTDADGKVLGLRDRWRLHVLRVRNLFLARPWRNAAGVRGAAMRAVARVRVARPAGPAAAEHICVFANPATLDELDEYQAIEEAAWDIGEKYRHATAGQPAAGPEVSVWIVADPNLPRGYVRVRAALRQPLRSDFAAHATVALTPGDVMPRGAGARPAVPRSNAASTPVTASQSNQDGPTSAPYGSAEPISDDAARTAPQPVVAAPSVAVMRPSDGGGAGAGAVPDVAPDATRAVSANSEGAVSANSQTVVIPRANAGAGTADACAANASAAVGVAETRPFSSPAEPPQSTPTAPPAGAPTVPVAQLLDATGGPLGQAVPLPDGTKLTVGRDPQSAIVVPNLHVSRSHLQVRASGGKVWVRDLGSRGGTEVSGRRLEAGDEVAVPIGTLIGLSPQPQTGRPAVTVRIG